MDEEDELEFSEPTDSNPNAIEAPNGHIFPNAAAALMFNRTMNAEIGEDDVLYEPIIGSNGE